MDVSTLDESKAQHRGKVVFSAEKSKDKKEHFPINSAAQARNALARSHQYKSAPSWYSGTLMSLQNSVRRAVKSAYPSIEIANESKKGNQMDKEKTKDAPNVDGKPITHKGEAAGGWAKEVYGSFEEYKEAAMKDAAFENEYKTDRDVGFTGTFDEWLKARWDSFNESKTKSIKKSSVNETKEPRDTVDPSRGVNLLKKLLKRNTR
jgi:hypothetical protein